MAGRRAGALDRWANAIGDMGRPAFWVTYVVAFLAMLAAFFFGFICHGKGFIWTTDGLEQQYMLFIQEGQWIRDLLHNVFVAGTFEIPMWSQQIGYGADFIYSACMTLGNPINLLSVFAYPETADWILEATVPLTLFLAGLTFLWYCAYKRFDPFASLVGSFVYAFSGYSFLAFSQVYMLYVLVLAPLVVRGVDRVFDGRSPLGFIVAMALAFLLGVSTGYMICILLFVYCLVKFLFLPEKGGFVGFLKWVGRIAGPIVLSALIAGVLFYPLAANILSQGRLGLERVNDLLYPLTYYTSLVQGFLTVVDVGADCMIGFAPIALVCIALLFSGKAGRGEPARMAKVLFAVFTVMLLLPEVGRVTNGFAYANNRWVFAYSLLAAVIVVLEIPRLRGASGAEKRKAAAIMGAYAAVCLACVVFSRGEFSSYLGFVGLVFTLAVCYALARADGAFKLGLLATLVVSCFLVSYPFGLGLSDERVDFGASYEAAASGNPASLVADLDSANASTRYDTGPGVPVLRNGNWAVGLSGSTFYNSYYNSYVDEYHTSLGLATSSMNFAYCTFDSRTAMEALGGVGYFVARDGNRILVPPTFDEAVSSGSFAGQDYVAYAADSVVPLAYVGKGTLSRGAYDRLGLVERQEALLQSVVLEGDGVADSDVASHAARLPYSVSLEVPDGSTLDVASSSPERDDAEVYLDGSQGGTAANAVPETLSREAKAASVTLSGNSIEVAEPRTVLYFDVDIPADVEAYFCIEGLDFESAAETGGDQGDLSFLQRVKAGLRGLVASVPRETFLYVYSDGMRQEIWQTNGRHHLYGGKDDWAVNLGYSDHARKTVAVEFREPGTYTFDSLEIVAEDSAAVMADIDALARAGAEDIRYEGNALTCRVDGAEEGDYLAVRMPYNTGWSATVDGEPVEVVRSNVGFMAVRLPAGSSQVALSFEMPHLRVGALMTVLGVALTAVVVSVSRIRRKAAAQPPRGL